MNFGARPPAAGSRRGSLDNIDDSDPTPGRFPAPVVVTTRVHLIVVLSPPLLAELAARRLAALDVDVVVAGEDTPGLEGHYDVVLRNAELPVGVSGDLVVDLPIEAGGGPLTAAAGELVSVDRLDDVADLLARRWPSDDL